MPPRVNASANAPTTQIHFNASPAKNPRAALAAGQFVANNRQANTRVPNAMIKPPAIAERAAFQPFDIKNTSAASPVHASCIAANFSARRLPRRAVSFTCMARIRITARRETAANYTQRFAVLQGRSRASYRDL
jgi:hypothetical protein